jgi:hypothetical protein
LWLTLSDQHLDPVPRVGDWLAVFFSVEHQVRQAVSSTLEPVYTPLSDICLPVCSFYPQVWENWKRKSVIGLNFDYQALNITG